MTEVHHVNGEGEDAGIVYCEMQARENLEHSLVSYNFLQSMYPGHCGYKVLTLFPMGGICPPPHRLFAQNQKIGSF